MHMLMVIVGGIVPLGVFLLFGQLWGGTPPALATAAKVFIPVWLIVSVANLWVGVNKAGCTVIFHSSPKDLNPSHGFAT